MEIRNTPPKQDASERPTPQLVQDLCIALRNVAVRDSSLPNDGRAVAYVEEVKAIHADENTVLIDFADPDGLFGQGRCQRCLRDELRRRGVTKHAG